MGSLSDRIKAGEKRPGSFTGCSVCRWYGALPKKDQAEFDTWIASGWKRRDLHKLCAEEGLTVGLSSFNTHVRDCVTL